MTIYDCDKKILYTLALNVKNEVFIRDLYVFCILRKSYILRNLYTKILKDLFRSIRGR